MFHLLARAPRLASSPAHPIENMKNRPALRRDGKMGRRMARVKGTNVLGAVKTLRAHRERALPLLPPELQRYLDERILVSSWYPEEDQIGLLRVIATLLPSTPDAWVMMGRSAAQGDLAGVYRNYVRQGDPQRTLLLMPGLWRNYHDTGEMDSRSDGPNRSIVTLSGYRAACREMCRIVAGYAIEVPTQAGARDVEVRKLTCCLEGAPECSWSVRWS